MSSKKSKNLLSRIVLAGLICGSVAGFSTKALAADLFTTGDTANVFATGADVNGAVPSAAMAFTGKAISLNVNYNAVLAEYGVTLGGSDTDFVVLKGGIDGICTKAETAVNGTYLGITGGTTGVKVTGGTTALGSTNIVIDANQGIVASGGTVNVSGNLMVNAETAVNVTGGTVNITGAKTVLNGNVTATAGTVDAVLTGRSSSWTGNVTDSSGTVNITLTNGATWNVTALEITAGVDTLTLGGDAATDSVGGFIEMRDDQTGNSGKDTATFGTLAGTKGAVHMDSNDSLTGGTISNAGLSVKGGTLNASEVSGKVALDGVTLGSAVTVAGTLSGNAVSTKGITASDGGAVKDFAAGKVTGDVAAAGTGKINATVKTVEGNVTAADTGSVTLTADTFKGNTVNSGSGAITLTVNEKWTGNNTGTGAGAVKVDLGDGTWVATNVAATAVTELTMNGGTIDMTPEVISSGATVVVNSLMGSEGVVNVTGSDFFKVNTIEVTNFKMENKSLTNTATLTFYDINAGEEGEIKANVARDSNVTLDGGTMGLNVTGALANYGTINATNVSFGGAVENNATMEVKGGSLAGGTITAGSTVLEGTKVTGALTVKGSGKLLGTNVTFTDALTVDYGLAVLQGEIKNSGSDAITLAAVNVGDTTEDTEGKVIIDAAKVTAEAIIVNKGEVSVTGGDTTPDSSTTTVTGAVTANGGKMTLDSATTTVKKLVVEGGTMDVTGDFTATGAGNNAIEISDGVLNVNTNANDTAKRYAVGEHKTVLNGNINATGGTANIDISNAASSWKGNKIGDGEVNITMGDGAKWTVTTNTSAAAITNLTMNGGTIDMTEAGISTAAKAIVATLDGTKAVVNVSGSDTFQVNSIGVKDFTMENISTAATATLAFDGTDASVASNSNVTLTGGTKGLNVTGDFTNAGTIGATNVTFADAVTNSGTINAETTIFEKAVTNSGTISLNGGSLKEAVTGAGALNISGVVTADKSVANVMTVATGGTLKINADDVDNKIGNKGYVELKGGTLTQVVTGGSIAATGTVYSDAANLAGDQNRITSNSTLYLTGDVTTGTNPVTTGVLAGALKGAGNVYIGVTGGTNVVEATAEQINTVGGTVAVVSGNTLNLSGNLTKNITNNGTVALAGDLQITGGTVAITGGTFDSNYTDTGIVKTIDMRDGVADDQLVVDKFIGGGVDLKIDVNLSNSGLGDGLKIKTGQDSQIILSSINIVTDGDATEKRFVTDENGSGDSPVEAFVVGGTMFVGTIGGTSSGVYEFSSLQSTGKMNVQKGMVQATAKQILENYDVTFNGLSLTGDAKLTDNATVVVTDPTYSKDVFLNGHTLDSDITSTDRTITISGETTTTSYTLNINGGTLGSNINLSSAGGATLNVTDVTVGGDVTNSATTNFDGTNTINGTINNSATMNFDGTNTINGTITNSSALNFDGTNYLNGAATNDGTMVVDGVLTANKISGTGTLTVKSGATMTANDVISLAQPTVYTSSVTVEENATLKINTANLQTVVSNAGTVAMTEGTFGGKVEGGNITVSSADGSAKNVDIATNANNFEDATVALNTYTKDSTVYETSLYLTGGELTSTVVKGTGDGNAKIVIDGGSAGVTANANLLKVDTALKDSGDVLVLTGGTLADGVIISGGGKLVIDAGSITDPVKARVEDIDVTGGIENKQYFTLTGGETDATLKSSISGEGWLTVAGKVDANGNNISQSTLTITDAGELHVAVANLGLINSKNLINNGNLYLTSVSTDTLDEVITGTGTTYIGGDLTLDYNSKIQNKLVVQANSTFTNNGKITGNVVNNGTMVVESDYVITAGQQQINGTIVNNENAVLTLNTKYTNSTPISTSISTSIQNAGILNVSADNLKADVTNYIFYPVDHAQDKLVEGVVNLTGDNEELTQKIDGQIKVNGEVVDVAGTLNVKGNIEADADNIAVKNTYVADGKTLTLTDGTLVGAVKTGTDYEGGLIIAGDVVAEDVIEIATTVNQHAKLTIDADNVDAAITNNGKVALQEGTLENTITGGNVILNGDVATDVVNINKVNFIRLMTTKNVDGADAEYTLSLSGGTTTASAELKVAIGNESCYKGTTAIIGNISATKAIWTDVKVAEDAALTIDADKLQKTATNDSKVDNAGTLTLNGGTAKADAKVLGKKIEGAGTTDVNGYVKSGGHDITQGAVIIGSDNGDTIDSCLDMNNILTAATTVKKTGRLEIIATNMVGTVANEGQLHLEAGDTAATLAADSDVKGTGTTTIWGDVNSYASITQSAVTITTGKTLTMNDADLAAAVTVMENAKLVVNAANLKGAVTLTNATTEGNANAKLSLGSSGTDTLNYSVTGGDVELTGNVDTDSKKLIENKLIDLGGNILKITDAVTEPVTELAVSIGDATHTDGTLEIGGTTKLADGKEIYTAVQVDAGAALTADADKFVGDKGIVNYGTLTLTGGSVVEEVEKPAKLGSHIEGTGNTTVDGIVNSEYEIRQNTVTINAGKSLSMYYETTDETGAAKTVDSLLRAHVDIAATGILDVSADKMQGSVANEGILNLYGGTLVAVADHDAPYGATITGKGHTNVLGAVQGDAIINQKTLTVKAGASLDMNKDLVLTDEEDAVTAEGALVEDTASMTISADNLKAATKNLGTLTLETGTLAAAYIVTDNAVTETTKRIGDTVIDGAVVSEAAITQDTLTINVGKSLDMNALLTVTKATVKAEDDPDATVFNIGASNMKGLVENNGKFNLEEGTLDSASTVTGTGNTYIKGDVESDASIAQKTLTVEAGNTLDMDNVLALTDKAIVAAGSTLKISASNLQGDVQNSGNVVFDVAGGVLGDFDITGVEGSKVNVNANTILDADSLATESENDKMELNVAEGQIVLFKSNGAEGTADTLISTITTGSTGTYQIDSSYTLTSETALNSAIDNDGTLNISATNVNGNVDNSGTLNLTAGNLNKNVKNTGVMNVNESVVMGSGNAITGKDGWVYVNGGTFVFNNPNKDSFDNNAVIAVGATLDPNAEVFTADRTIVDYGTLVIDNVGTLAADVTVDGSAAKMVLEKSSINLAETGSITQLNGSTMEVKIPDPEATGIDAVVSGVTSADQLNVSGGVLDLSSLSEVASGGVQKNDQITLVKGDAAAMKELVKLDNLKNSKLWKSVEIADNGTNLVSDIDTTAKYVTDYFVGDDGQSVIAEVRSVKTLAEVNTNGLAGVQQGALAMVSQMNDRVAAQMSLTTRPAAEKGDKYQKQIWASYINTKEDVEDRELWNLKADNTAKYKGAIVGVDFYSSKKAIAGVAFSYTTGDISANTINSTRVQNDSKYYGVTLYDRVTNGNVAWTYDIGYQNSKNEISMFARENVTSDVKTNAYTAGIRVEGALEAGKNSTFAPFLSVRYMRLNTGDYTNSNGSHFESNSQNLFIPKVGLAWRGNFGDAKKGNFFRPVLEIGYIFNAGNRSAETEYLSSTGHFFNTEYDIVDGGTYYGQAGLNFISGRFSLGLVYRYLKGSTTKNSKWNANMDWAF